ncbi:hypothetical protein U9K47_15195 [Bacillus toyonensis]|uniref:hypothetical protein n=1 Tax=Bacillus toyonensis TaxID=155322 RepID=UPI003465F5F9
MDIISLELVKVKKSKLKQKRIKMTVIPIIELVFEVNGAIQFIVIGEKEVPVAWIEKE